MASRYSSLSGFRSSFGLCFCLFFLHFLGMSGAQLTSDFYASPCPNVLSIIKSAVNSAVENEPRVGASLLRLHVNDCFLNGCDASVLLDDAPDFTGEKTAGQNLNSATGFAVVDTIKSELESSCPGVVSCADVLAAAARNSVVALGGPSWIVRLGRRDSTTASFSTANIPSPSMNLTALITAFSYKGFTADAMVALSGAHTIGQAKCSSFRKRLYGEEANIDASFQSSLRASCPRSGGDNNLSPLDIQSSTTFDNAYFRNLVTYKGLLHSDQQLFNGGSTDSLVIAYSTNYTAFFTDFANAMVKMGNLNPLTGTSGQIRTNCRKINCRVPDQVFVYEII